ncbi:hypothetical protein Tco_1122511 [Tanacetum coccineum]|uniref:Uncharacterized protein n=2 Tax=Tanacetum coccineum TaxID=301880 RepID=A0ABQ5J1T4_9ASTR
MAIPNVPFRQGIGSGGSPMCQEAIGDTIAQTRFERLSIPSYDSPLLGVNTPGSDEKGIELKELMDMCTKLSDRVLDLENDEHMFDLSDLAGTEVVCEEEPIELVEDKAQRLQAELDEEARLERERKNLEWLQPNEDRSIEARIDADAQLAERLQVEEREQMSVEEEVNNFVPMDTESSRKKVDISGKKVKSSKKRTRAVLGEENVKKQKVEDDVEKAELKAYLEIVLNDDSDVNIESLATKYPIVDWKTHILAKKKKKLVMLH